MLFWIFVLLFVTRSFMAVTVIINGTEVDCSLDCVCCKGGRTKCDFTGFCPDGCVDTIYGNTCHNPCPGNCKTCTQRTGLPCHTCRSTFYDTNKMCIKRCSVGCDGGTCDDVGNCPCTANFEGNTCDTCTQGFNGPSCATCTTGYYGADCKKCSSGCRNENCINDGTCDQCIDNCYGTYCDLTCSVGCNGGVCIQDGSCNCKENFTGKNCETCREGKYGTDCQNICSMGCFTLSCDRNNGFCVCVPNFTGSKCDQCSAGFYGQSRALHCSENCKGRICLRYDGECIDGCVDGYSGNNCTTVCDSRCTTCEQSDKSICLSCFNEYTGLTCSYPPNCYCSGNRDLCTSCSNLWKRPDYQCKCHAKYCNANGCNACINNTYFFDSNMSTCCECPPNSKGGFCTTSLKCTDGCEDGFYGIDCSLTCKSLDANSVKCSQISARCLKCNNGLYPHANGSCIRCKSNCRNMQCSSDNGTCLIGCTGTFWGHKCDSQCNLNCETCQQESGICDDCSDNTFHGSYCNHSCSSSCFESKCDQISGHCSFGFAGDFFGHLCQINCPENCKQSGTETRCNANGNCAFGCVYGYAGDDCTKRQMDMGSPTNIALAVLSGVLGILLIFTAASCYLWNRRLSKSTEQNPGIQLDQNETERTYEQLQRQANEPTYRNVDENYSVLSM